jgi:hypothetical protein
MKTVIGLWVMVVGISVYVDPGVKDNRASGVEKQELFGGRGCDMFAFCAGASRCNGGTYDVALFYYGQYSTRQTSPGCADMFSSHTNVAVKIGKPTGGVHTVTAGNDDCETDRLRAGDVFTASYFNLNASNNSAAPVKGQYMIWDLDNSGNGKKWTMGNGGTYVQNPTCGLNIGGTVHQFCTACLCD